MKNTESARFWIFAVIICISDIYIYGQSETSYRAEAFASVASGEHTPFWTVNQSWGITPLEANNFYLRGGVFHEQKLSGNFSFDAGIDLVGGAKSFYGNVWIQQLYGRINWKIFRLDLGQREDYTSFLNSRLSSGDFVESNNFRPIPGVKFSVPEFTLIPFTKGNLYFKGDFFVGKYLDDKWKENRAAPLNRQYATGILYHRKSVYFRFGNIETSNRMQFAFGMNHAAQWGGTLYSFSETENRLVGRAQPQDLDDFIRIFMAKEGSANSTAADRVHVAGSQWGAYTLKYDYRLENNSVLSIYTNHLFEDGSGMGFQNYMDGIFGIEYSARKPKAVSGVVFEYIYTKQQTGAVHFNHSMDDEHRDKLFKKGNGGDNYYNNVDYAEGPSYFGHTLGTPLFLSPMYNTDGSLNFKGTRIMALHMGLEGFAASTLQYRILLTAGKNYGTHFIPFSSVKKGIASQLELKWSPKSLDNWDFTLSLACDRGEFFGGDTAGAALSVVKRGIIR
ncbi:MAG: capsule assembly Wzi family protein [Dysgonamonadaceae bacterium]|nr:capsule assembly Wzi family protein [Dysgonamonadaceae bacterium]